MRLGLGCMRLPDNRDAAVAVVHAALDAGATVLDTADVYGPDPAVVGANERVVAEALRTWRGDTSRVLLATKGGMTRDGRRWLPNGKAKHLIAAAQRSRDALGVDAIPLYLLHAPDPRTPFATSLRALRRLIDDGVVARVGLCNVTAAELREALDLVPVSAVQVELSLRSADAIRGGVVESALHHSLLVLAHRPLGGPGKTRALAKLAGVRELAARHGVAVETLALAALADVGVVPIPGASRIATAAALADVSAVHLSDADRAALDRATPPLRQLRVPRARRRPPDDATGDVVVMVGLPGSGKSTTSRALGAEGYARLNRDEHGGRLADLVPELDRLLGEGQRRVVLDNTYPSRARRNDVVETAWRHGVPVRCVYVDTPVEDCLRHVATRLVRAHGHLPDPEELAALGKIDPHSFGPEVIYRAARAQEGPTVYEGFVRVDVVRAAVAPPGDKRGIVVALDALGDATGISPEAASRLRGADFDVRAVITWLPGATRAEADALLAAVAREVGVPIVGQACVHVAGPPVCWCRRPLPGHGVVLVEQHGIDPARSTLVGASTADRTFAARLGFSFMSAAAFSTR